MYDKMSISDLVRLYSGAIAVANDLAPMLEDGRLDPSPWQHVLEVLTDQADQIGRELERREDAIPA